MVDPFLYVLAGVSVFYCAAILTLIHAFLRYKIPRSKRLVMNRLNIVSLCIVLDGVTYIIGIAILFAIFGVRYVTSHFNAELYSALFVVSWVPIFLLAAKLWRSIEDVRDNNRNVHIEHSRNEEFGLIMFLSVSIALVVLSFYYYLYPRRGSTASFEFFLIYFLVLLDGLMLILWMEMKYGVNNQINEVENLNRRNEPVESSNLRSIQVRVARKASFYVFLASFLIELMLYVVNNSRIVEMGIPFDNPYFSGLGYLTGISFVLWIAFLISGP